MTTETSLSWALVIATYRRENILPDCLKFAAEQTRRPTEIVVVDASDDWQTTRDRVMTTIAPQYPNIRWVYVAATQPSLTLQRNQAIRLATADVVFLLDDDSFMYPTCAEEVMRVYEADPQQLVQGVQAATADQPPSVVNVSDAKHYSSESRQLYADYGIASAIFRFFWKNVLLMNSETNFIPYEGSYPTYEIPEAVSQLNVQVDHFLAGFRMTYRRAAVLKEPFEPLLRYYAAWEDIDASYRVSRHGLLMTAIDAKVHHFYSAAGRVKRYQIAALSSLNQAVCLRKHSSNLKRDVRSFYLLMLRRVLAEMLKDVVSRRWTFPQLRGILFALRRSRLAFSLPEERLTEWYPHLQQQIVSRA